MRFDRSFVSLFALGLGLLLSSAWTGCSQSSGPDTKKDAAASGGSGGTAGSGGTSASGGVTSGGVSGSGGGSGGVVESGGSSGSGGKASGGTTSVGTGGKGAGGTKSQGGATGQGGDTVIGGTPGKGGSTGNGGATGKGGAGIDGGGNGGVVGSGGSTGVGGCPELPTAPASDVITFTSSGGWCWYQDERAVVDTKGNKLVIGSVIGSGSGVGNIQATIYDLAGKKATTTKLGNLSVDDHDAPALNITPEGKYVAVWATHRTDCNTYYSIYDGTWGAQKSFDWKKEGCPWDGDNTHMITYSNVWYMDGNLFDIARSVGTSPNLLQSTDDGATWSYYGRLTYTPLTGYVAGYYKYWGNNTDRIDFLGTEAHPRDNDNSLWHGYIKGGKIYKSDGTVVDDALAGTSATTSAKNIDQYTQIFKTGTSPVGGPKLCRMWNHDIVRYADGTIAALGQGRADNCTGTPSGSDPDKRAVYARFDGTKWTVTYLAKMGAKLYDSEQDYTGLGALHPDNPHIIYLSTPYDPNTDTMGSSGKHEIWQGVTCDNGATWKWAAVTKGSTQENIRPIVPKWDADHTALLWMKGTYTTAQNFATAVVGVISGP